MINDSQKNCYFLLLLFSICILTFLIFHGSDNGTKSSDFTVLTVETKCREQEKALKLVPPFINLLNDYAVAESHKIIGCNLRKSMSQLNYNIMCYLSNSTDFLQNNYTFADTWHDERCAGITYLDYEKKVADKLVNFENFTKFVFVRDPVERFASLYVDKCIREKACGSCTNMRCNVKYFYDLLIQVSESIDNLDPSLKWLVWHIAPISWNCDFKDQLRDYHLIKMGSKQEDREAGMRKLARILDESRVEKRHIEHIINETLSSNTVHATYGSTEIEGVWKQIKSDKYIRDYIYRIYFYDYVTFGFDMSLINEFKPYLSF